MAWQAKRRLWAGLAIGLVALAALPQALAGVVVASYDRLPSCPGPAEWERFAPTAIQLSPQLVQHRNWIEFPAPPGAEPLQPGQRPARGASFLLCLDGELFEQGPQSVGDGVVRFSVATRWVDAMWLRGRLDAYRSPDRWRMSAMVCVTGPTGRVFCDWARAPAAAGAQSVPRG